MTGPLSWHMRTYVISCLARDATEFSGDKISHVRATSSIHCSQIIVMIELKFLQCDQKFLTKRSDDSERVISDRYETYLKETFPLIKYYLNQNLLKEINGNQKIDQINKEIRQIIVFSRSIQ